MRHGSGHGREPQPGGACRAVLALIFCLSSVTLEAADDDIRRFYADNRYGQLHVHHASPQDGRRVRPPLVLFHQTPLSGRVFEDLLPKLAIGRDVYAVDTPGYGESDPPPAPATIEQYAAAIADWLQTLPVSVDVMGYHTGVLLATELAATRPQQVRRVVLVSVPLFDEERRRAYEPERTAFEEDGTHLLDMWRSTMSVRPEGQSLEQVARIVAEKQRAGSRAWWAGPAIFAYDTAAALRQVRQPTLVLRPGDGLYENSGEAARLLSDAAVVDRPAWGFGLFDVHAMQVADIVLEFLDRGAGTTEPPAADGTAGIVSVLSRIAIVVADVAASRRFYTEGLGYEVLFEGDIGRPIVKQQLGISAEQTAYFVVLTSSHLIDGIRREGAMIGLLEIGNPAPPEMTRPADTALAIGEGMMAVRTSDIEAVHARLREFGASIVLEPLASPDGTQTELVVRDPDGFRIHVVEREDPPTGR